MPFYKFNPSCHPADGNQISWILKWSLNASKSYNIGYPRIRSERLSQGSIACSFLVGSGTIHLLSNTKNKKRSKLPKNVHII